MIEDCQRSPSAPLAALLSIVAFALGCGIELESEPWNPPPAAARADAIAPREACANRTSRRQPLYGDLHIHTGYSMDARAMGTVATPDDAYRYALGQPIDIYPGTPDLPPLEARIDRPLDFAAVTDHAEWLAEVSLCTTPGSEPYDSRSCRIFRGEERTWLAKLLGLKGFRANLLGLVGFTGRDDTVCGADDARCRRRLLDVWRDTKASAERWYDRTSACRFTTFHAWEYSRSPRSTKIHRNVILRNELGPELPISALETPHERELRHQLRDLCNDTATGCEAIAIPHNPNLSNGQLFALWYADLPEAEQRAEAALRAELEPIVEMTQLKGDSECRNGFPGVVGAPDELCDFEKNRDFGNPDLEVCEEPSWGAQAGKGCIAATDFVRYALVEGMKEKARLGVNPFPFGFIGSTDTHMATSGGSMEWEPPKKAGATTESLLSIGQSKRSPAFFSAGGLAGVWAEANDRDSIFDAMKRRETFASSGPRIAPRFYGGWSLPDEICQGDLVAQGDRQGVPMGGEITEPPAGAAPVFAVSALRDPGTPNHPGGLLQRLQIVKGWVGDDGRYQQEVHDVAGGPNTARVDLDTCVPEGPGADELCGVWRDPAFEPDREAVYYARIVENPSCRWSTRICNTLAPDARPDGCASERLPKTIQERAWTSPIWYVR